MKLTEEIKQAIINEYNAFKAKMYAGKSKKERKDLDQFFTPPELTIAMIEKFDCESLADKKILDPCCGSGNLLMACLIAGAKPRNLYGNDYDKRMAKLCRHRLNTYIETVLGIPSKNVNLEHHIHWGNALQRMCLTDFSKEYRKNYIKKVEADPSLLDNLKFAQKDYTIPTK